MGNHSLRHQMEALKLLHELNGTRTARSNAEVSSDDSGSRRKSLKHKPQTVAERARESQFSRLVEILSQIISIEQDLLGPLSEDLGSFLLRHKVRGSKSLAFSLLTYLKSILSTSCLSFSGQRRPEEHLSENGS